MRYLFLFVCLFLSVQTLANFECVTVKKTEGLHLQKCDNLNILWLSGNPVERARHHGELLGKEFTLDNLNLFVALSIRGVEKDSFKYTFIDNIINFIVAYAASAAPDSYHEEVQALAEAAGVSTIKMKRALLLPDIAAFSWALMSKKGKNLPHHGCTSAVYTDDSGHFIQGRNLDFPGTPSYDKNPLLVIHKPKPDSGELQHVSIGTHGLNFSGITGFNEAGLTFAVHQNYTMLKQIRGVPMPYVGELVLRSAQNLDEALEIIKNNRPGPLWTFILSDLKTNSSLTVEVSRHHFNVRKKEGNYFSQTNHLVSNLKSELALMDAGTVQNSKFRFDKALETMKSWKNPSAKNMAELLGWQKSRQSFSPVSDVLKSLTIQSVVYEKNKISTNFYVTIDPAPAPTGRWAQFNMNSFWQKDSFSADDMKIFDFVKLPAQLRDQQKRWTEIYAFEIMHKHHDVIERLDPIAASPDSFLALSALQLKVENPKDSLVSAQKGLKLVTDDTSQLIKQGLQWVEIAALWQMGKKDLVLSHAVSLSNQGIVDPGVQNEISKILKNDSPSESSLHPGFDFFGGYLQGMPSRQ